MGEQDNVMIHDLELGRDGMVYGINMSINGIVSLDPETGERENYTLPSPYRGPHSIEMGNDGNMWLTLCISGEMAKFDVTTKEWTIASSAESPKPRGSYPHTLRINPDDPEGLVWYTDAGSNAVFSMHPETLEVAKYELLQKDQAIGSGRGESRGITPYGLDYSPVDGSIWYTKLNGNRIGRIDPTVEGGDIKEWVPPFRGPRRLHIAQDGLVWVPGFGSGVFGSFDPKTEEWEVYDLPSALDQIPYALNIDPKGNIWITGTGNDTLAKFDPKTKELVEFRMPTRVTYTREFEFDADGNVWTCNSNAPIRHSERGRGSIIKLELLGSD
jgi:streptogramin lyase